MREVVLHTLSVHLGPDGGSHIYEIAAVELEKGKPTGRFFHEQVKPDLNLPDEIIAASPELSALKGAPGFAAIAGRLVAFIGDARIVYHHDPASAGQYCDLAIVNQALVRAGCKPVTNPSQNSFPWAMSLYGKPQAQAWLLAGRFNVGRDALVARHGAMLGEAIVKAAISMQVRAAWKKAEKGPKTPPFLHFGP